MSLWLVDPPATFDADALAWLSVEEADRAARFRRSQDRLRYLAAHVALRLIVEQCCGIAPQHQRYEDDALGKGRLSGGSACQFSLSYGGGRVLIGVAHSHAIGVDLEAERVMGDAVELAALHFDDEERAAYEAAPGGAEDIAFLRGWTRKEACLKAIGTGLRVPPVSLHTGLEGTTRVIAGEHLLDVGSFRIEGLIGAWAQVC